MYAWFWRKLPGTLTTKAITAAVLVLGIVALLMFVIFPWVEPMLPFNDVSVQ